jgi:DNA repair protein RadC
MHKIKRYVLTYRAGPAFENIDISDRICAHEFCKTILSKIPIEKILIIALDCQKRLIGYDYHIGVPSECNLYFQRVFHFLMSMGAESFILAHNHPNGDTVSSKEDRVLRDSLRTVGAMLDIPLVDCIIVSGERSRGMMRDK